MFIAKNRGNLLSVVFASPVKDKLSAAERDNPQLAISRRCITSVVLSCSIFFVLRSTFINTTGRKAARASKKSSAMQPSRQRHIWFETTKNFEDSKWSTTAGVLQAVPAIAPPKKNLFKTTHCTSPRVTTVCVLSQTNRRFLGENLVSSSPCS